MERLSKVFCHFIISGRERLRKANHQNNPDRVLGKDAPGHYRDRATIKRLNMYRSSGPIRNKAGKIIGGDYMSKEAPDSARIAPNRSWFGRLLSITK